jgi:hypothetical protein
MRPGSTNRGQRAWVAAAAAGMAMTAIAGTATMTVMAAQTLATGEQG